MDQLNRILLASNSFYNAGLEHAKIRDLTGAAGYLKKCLNLNKYHIDARNLLGLIYYEMGEVSEALVQWVISMNFMEKNNRADYYLDQIQRKPERLDLVRQNVKRYNQALVQARTGSDDLAVLQLMRVVDSNPRFVKAHLLLALLYMSHEDYTKAGKSLYKVLKIDKNNPKANWYMSIVKDKTGKAEIERRKLKNAFSHRQMQDDDVIIPPSYKENTGWQSILNIGAGLILGAAVVFFLVMPAKARELNNLHNQEILSYNEQLNQKNVEIASLNDTVEGAKSSEQEAKQQLDTILNSNDSVINQYGTLVKILQAYRRDDLLEVVSLYSGFDSSLFTDEAILAIANSVKQDVETNGYQTLEDLAYTMWSAGRLGEAAGYYQTCLAIRPANPKVIFNLGMIKRSQNQADEAIQLFTQVLTQHADSEYAEKARKQLAELQPQGQAASAPGQAGVTPPAGDAGAAGGEAGAPSAGGNGQAGGSGQTGSTGQTGGSGQAGSTGQTRGSSQSGGNQTPNTGNRPSGNGSSGGGQGTGQTGGNQPEGNAPETQQPEITPEPAGGGHGPSAPQESVQSPAGNQPGDNPADMMQMTAPQESN